MAGKVGRDGTTLLKIVNLGVILRENRVMLLLFALLHVHEGVSRPSHQHCGSALIERIIGDLEIADGALDVTLAPDASLRNQLLTVPIPEEHLPIRLACQRHDHFLVLGAEGARNELLRVIRVDVLDLLGQRLSLLLAVHVVDRKFALVTGSASLADGDVLLALGEGHVGDSLSIV